jgi:hypothetical protein
MINIKDRRCSQLSCMKIPLYNYDGEKKGLFCCAHKKVGMINVRTRKCIHPGCRVVPNFNLEGEVRGIYCFQHRQEGMVNVSMKLHVKCLHEKCRFRVANPPYCSVHKP